MDVCAKFASHQGPDRNHEMRLLDVFIIGDFSRFVFFLHCLRTLPHLLQTDLWDDSSRSGHIESLAFGAKAVGG